MKGQTLVVMPFHEAVVETLRMTSTKEELRILGHFIRVSDIPKGYLAIRSAWTEMMARHGLEDDMGVPEHLDLMEEEHEIIDVADVVESNQLVIGNRIKLKKHALRLIGPGKNVVLDCEGIEYIDSSGLAVLVGLVKKLQEAGGEEVVLKNLNKDIKTLFGLTKLSARFKIEE